MRVRKNPHNKTKNLYTDDTVDREMSLREIHDLHIQTCKGNSVTEDAMRDRLRKHGYSIRRAIETPCTRQYTVNATPVWMDDTGKVWTVGRAYREHVAVCGDKAISRHSFRGRLKVMNRSIIEIIKTPRLRERTPWGQTRKKQSDTDNVRAQALSMRWR
jgi:2-keto-4-pentenoate hydratase/2-oxohepta-3-ene-1,7-dioic acid hydratase in catechol pathway